MKLAAVKIEHYRGIKSLTLPLDSQLTVLHGGNGCGKTSILTAIALAFAPQVHGEGRRVGLDKHIGLLGEPMISVIGEDGESLSSVEGMSVLDGVPRTMLDVTWGHTAPDGGFRPGVAKSRSDLLPPYMYYDVNRVVTSSLMERDVGTTVNYDHLFEWFYARENVELRMAKDNPQTVDPDLDAVRQAIQSMVPGATNPRIEMDPPRFVVSLREGSSRPRELSLEQLSDGYRSILAVAADIAWEMARQHEAPQHRSPEAEAVVLIDEIELHLHPSWQQHVLPDLIRTFPNAQFVVSTHSPQVLTTIDSRHIVELSAAAGGIVAGGTASATYGAAAGDVLSDVMGVDERPSNEFTLKLQEYLHLVSDGNGEAAAALSLRRELDRLSPTDAALDRADLEIKRRRLFKQMESKT